MTMGTDSARNRLRVWPAGRVAAITAAAAVTALVPAAAFAAGGGAPVAGDISTVAGGKGPGPAPATSVSFSPCGVSFAAGFVYADASETVRQVSLQGGQLTTPAGTGSFSPLGDGGLATRAGLDQACGTTVDGSGNLIIADGDRVRAVAAATGTFYGQAMHKGDIYTIAGGGGTSPADGVPATSAAIGAGGVALDAAGNLVIAGGNLLLVVAVKTGSFYGQAMTAGDLYIVAGGGHNGLGDGGPATFAEVSAAGVAVDAAGNLVIADRGNSRIRVVAVKTGTFYGQAMAIGDIYTVAGGGTSGLGDGGPATSAEVGPAGVAVDSAGNLVIADGGDARVRVVAATTGTFYGHAMTKGDIYTVAGNGQLSYSGDGGAATEAQLNDPVSVAVDAAGNQVIADLVNYRVRVAAAATGTFYGRAMTAGDIYTVAGTGKRDSGIPAFLHSGIPATKALITPDGVALDRAGNLVISEPRGIRVVAVKTGTFYGRGMTAGDIYTVAGNGGIGLSGDGGPATAAEFFDTSGVAADAAGNLIIADAGNDRVRVLAAKTGTFYGLPMTAGDIYTAAGVGNGLGDGGPAITAGLQPAGITLDAAGNVVTAITRIRSWPGSAITTLPAASSVIPAG